MEKKRKTPEEELPSIKQLFASVDSFYLFTKKPTLPLKIISEPDNWQISNYNVQPVLTIELPSDIEESAIKAELFGDGEQVTMGFQTASTQVVSRNTKIVSFNGLKLNTMKHLKAEAKKRNTNVREVVYAISINIGGMSVTTREFRIVSSFSQLPKEQQQLRTSRQLNKNE